jgi:hypothetical protein
MGLFLDGNKTEQTTNQDHKIPAATATDIIIVTSTQSTPHPRQKCGHRIAMGGVYAASKSSKFHVAFHLSANITHSYSGQ